jgi:hypothetical protein
VRRNATRCARAAPRSRNHLRGRTQAATPLTVAKTFPRRGSHTNPQPRSAATAPRRASPRHSRPSSVQRLAFCGRLSARPFSRAPLAECTARPRLAPSAENDAKLGTRVVTRCSGDCSGIESSVGDLAVPSRFLGLRRRRLGREGRNRATIKTQSSVRAADDVGLSESVVASHTPPP